MKTARLLLLVFALAAPAGAAERIVLPPEVIPEHYDVAITPDAAAARFTGSAAIELDVRQPTATIRLNAAELSFSRVALSGRSDAPQVSFDSAEDTASLTFATPLAPGRYVLTIDYAGKINANAAGLFYLDYDTAQGGRRALFTQFENSDARRFMPCWDEPARKATFTLSATVPAGEMAVSNMPVAAEEPLPGGLKRVRFSPSPKMSSYLLFFALGDFERLSQKVDGVDVGVVVRRGDGERGRFALDAAVHILPFYEDYFGIKYPLPKLDLVAGPGQSQFFGAMENWGAIFFFERDLLIDPKISTEGDKHDVYEVVAHEMAHQWSGDLVTMDWWDGIWLNEGFASWMEYKATDRFHPEWHVWLRALSGEERAMTIDARAGTHPIIQPIADVLQANQAFDAITYAKGMSVIRMLENYAGEDAWRKGVHAYLEAHAYGNTVTDDLWREIDKVSPRPVTQVAHDFTLQEGVPLMRVAATRRAIRVTQDRFAAMADREREETTWHVPVIERTLGAKREWRGVVSRDASAGIAVPNGGATIVNAGQTGYFRTLYDPILAARIAAHFAALAPADQLGLIDDAAALGYSGREPMRDFLRLVAGARPGMDPTVLSTVVDHIAALDEYYRDRPGRTAFRRFASRILRPLFAKVGWTEKPGEDSNLPLLRHDLLAALSELDDRPAIAAARARFAGFLERPFSLEGDLRINVFDIVAAHADATTWEHLHDLAKAAASPLEKRKLYLLLGATHDRALAERALHLAMTDEAPATLRPAIIAAVAKYHPDLAFEFALRHADEVKAALEPDSRNQFIPALAATSFEPATAAKLKAYAEMRIPPTARQTAVKAEAAIAYAAAIRAKRLPAIDRWLKGSKRP